MTETLSSLLKFNFTHVYFFNRFFIYFGSCCFLYHRSSLLIDLGVSVSTDLVGLSKFKNAGAVICNIRSPVGNLVGQVYLIFSARRFFRYS
ncbi:hypothetical protein L2E82_09141 [Cichorium intybus]|uniref:Uncharacterized protein n=1 Tax=Cichorium intybus TaxID=13427 RepID=A0ACB9G7J8_CICIN|nr:hypothetical protein L2E82_09141 [Cichorium intybus]